MELRPGDDLRERDLAEMLGVSRVPVREALPMLERAGLAQLSPRRTVRVTEITESDITGHFEVRTALEPLAARLAAQRVSNGGDPAALQAALTSAHDAMTRRDDQAFHDSNSLLHLEIERLAVNPLLDEVMTLLAQAPGCQGLHEFRIPSIGAVGCRWPTVPATSQQYAVRNMCLPVERRAPM